jgi:hypothetical protein
VVGGLVVVVVVDELLVEATAADLPEVPVQLVASRHPARVRPTWSRQRGSMMNLKGREPVKCSRGSETMETTAVLQVTDRQDHNLNRPPASSLLTPYATGAARTRCGPQEFGSVSGTPRGAPARCDKRRGPDRYDPGLFLAVTT